VGEAVAVPTLATTTPAAALANMAASFQSHNPLPHEGHLSSSGAAIAGAVQHLVLPRRGASRDDTMTSVHAARGDHSRPDDLVEW